ncbi:MAG: helix-turn-helix domain-containing protein, partial [Geminicoccaceae bacterium]
MKRVALAAPASCIGSTVDQQVSQRIRRRRILLGITQQQLADLIGITCQQTQKYERGINRVSSGRLYQIAQALGVEISYFFEDADPIAGDRQVDEVSLKGLRAWPDLCGIEFVGEVRPKGEGIVSCVSVA